MISIITITYNNYEELISTLDSIKNLRNIESIVINGGSCEKTLNFLQTYSGISLSEKDEGISDAFNKGIKLATGEAIMFLNSGDILIDQQYINEVNNLIMSEQQFDFFYSDIFYNDSLLGKKIIKASPRPRSLARGMPYPHQSLIIKKYVFNNVGFFEKNLKIAMDFDFVIRMFKLNFKKSHYTSRATVLMDGHGISASQELKCINENINILKRHNLYSYKIALRTNLAKLFFYLKKIHFIKRIYKHLRYDLFSILKLN